MLDTVLRVANALGLKVRSEAVSDAPIPRLSVRKYEHFYKVDLAHICACFSGDCKYRWVLDIPYISEPTRTETVSVILKNPSSAGECVADRTIQNVEKEIYRRFKAAAKLSILNLFAVRATYTKDVRCEIAQGGLVRATGYGNDNAIQRTLKVSDHVVAAWGGPSRIPNGCYNERVNQMIRMLSDYRAKLWRIGELSKKHKHPRHGMRWKRDDEMLRLDSNWPFWQAL